MALKRMALTYNGRNPTRGWGSRPWYKNQAARADRREVRAALRTPGVLTGDLDLGPQGWAGWAD